MGNNLVKADAAKLQVGKVQDFYMGELTKSLARQNITLDAEQTSCIRNALVTMQSLADKDGKKINEYSQTNIVGILEQIVLLRINLSAYPREGYMITRNQKMGSQWVSCFEFGIEGAGNEKLLRTYGVDVEKVYNTWIVREGDEFTLPAYNGTKVTPPTWRPKTTSAEPLYVVVPVLMKGDGPEEERTQYFFSDRESVAVNLKAAILNTANKKKDMTPQARAELSARISNMSLDDMFNDEQCLEFMSPAYKSPHSRKSMIIRKMINNTIKPIPKNFGSAYSLVAYNEASAPDETRVAPNPENVLEAEISGNAGQAPLQGASVIGNVGTQGQSAAPRPVENVQPQPQPQQEQEQFGMFDYNMPEYIPSEEEESGVLDTPF